MVRSKHGGRMRKRLGAGFTIVAFVLVAGLLGVLILSSTASASAITEFTTVPTPNSELTDITAGSDGNLWFTEQAPAANKIGRITPSGTITEFTVPTPSSSPYGITAGPDGNLWFTEFFGNKIGRITTGGTITEFAVPTTTSGPRGITSGPDGDLWFTEFFGNKIGRLQYAEPSSTPTANTWVTNGDVKAIVNANGITYIGGSFT